jgi:Arc/MetJ family transcription regulator
VQAHAGTRSTEPDQSSAEAPSSLVSLSHRCAADEVVAARGRRLQEAKIVEIGQEEARLAPPKFDEKQPLEASAATTMVHAEYHHLMLYLMSGHEGQSMRTTINIDDELLAKAAKLTGSLDRSAMVREGLKALIERESARRLARLGGSQRDLKAPPRRRQGSAA